MAQMPWRGTFFVYCPLEGSKAFQTSTGISQGKAGQGMSDKTYGEELKEVVQAVVKSKVLDRVIDLDFEDSGATSRLFLNVEDGPVIQAEAQGDFTSLMTYHSWWQVQCDKGFITLEKGQLLGWIQDALKDYQ